MHVTFEYPIYLSLLLLIPVLFFIHLVTLRTKKKGALKFANFEAISRISGVDFFSKNITVLLLSVLLIFLLTMASAGLTVHIQMKASSFSFILAVDSSQSMGAEDMPPNRLDVAKETAVKFVDSAPISTRIGVVSFSGRSFIEQALTENKGGVKGAIGNIRLESFGGTDLYEVIVTSTNLLAGEEAGAIVLLSDGQINVGAIEEGIDYANDNDLIIHTIAIGTGEGGKTAYGISKLDEDALKAVAYNTGGIFFKTENRVELEKSFEDILKLTTKKVPINLSTYLVVISTILFVIGYLLINTKYKSLP